jgi:hypothetical protein
MSETTDISNCSNLCYILVSVGTVVAILFTASLVGLVSRRRSQRIREFPNPVLDEEFAESARSDEIGRYFLERVVMEEFLLVDETGKSFVPPLTLNRDNVETVYPEVSFERHLACGKGESSTPEVVFCSICLDEINSQNVVRKLFCGHIFHSSCILHWILVGRSKSCPLCQKSIAMERSSLSCRSNRATTESDWNYLFFFI